ncbi:(3S,6E)-nerolidol synthase 1 [Glycine max]|nr:(3S,6E)-nerolidol synthase 1 [Glycine max]
MVCLWERSLPSAEEYLKNGIVSSGVHIVMVHAFSLLGHGLTEENVQIIDRNPVIISSPATILRLWDDLGNAERAYCQISRLRLVVVWNHSGPLHLIGPLVSTGVHMILVQYSFFFMGQAITKENVTIMDEFPNIISTTATILRLCDDLEGDRDVNGDGNYGLYMKCYMKEHPHVSIEQTREHVTRMISDAWKRLNQECLMSHDRCKSFTIIFH